MRYQRCPPHTRSFAAAATHDRPSKVSSHEPSKPNKFSLAACCPVSHSGRFIDLSGEEIILTVFRSCFVGLHCTQDVWLQMRLHAARRSLVLFNVGSPVHLILFTSFSSYFCLGLHCAQDIWLRVMARVTATRHHRHFTVSFFFCFVLTSFSARPLSSS